MRAAVLGGALMVALGGEVRGQALILHLKNGDRLSGHLVSSSTNQMVLDTRLGTITVPLNEIERQENAATPAADAAARSNAVAAAVKELKSLNDSYQTGKVPAAEYFRKRFELLETVRNAGSNTGSQGLAGRNWQGGLADLAAKRPPAAPGATAKEKAKKRWSGEASVGTDMSFGTKKLEIFSGRLKGQYAESNFRNALDYSFTYGTTDGERSANRMQGSMKTDWGITPRFYVYNLGGGGYDEIRRIDQRYELGPGLGYEVVRTDPFRFSLEFGVNYQSEQRDTGEQIERFYYRMANIAALKITERLTLDEKFEFFPPVEEFSQYRFRLEANLRYLLFGNLVFLVTLLDQYDRSPASKVDRNDLQIRSSIGVKF